MARKPDKVVCRNGVSSSFADDYSFFFLRCTSEYSVSGCCRRVGFIIVGVALIGRISPNCGWVKAGGGNLGFWGVSRHFDSIFIPQMSPFSSDPRLSPLSGPLAEYRYSRAKHSAQLALQH